MSLYFCGEECWHGGPLPDMRPEGDAVVMNGLELNRGGAFMCLNSYVLTDRARKVRVNTPMPDLDGELGARGRRVAREVDLEVRVVGYVDEADALQSDIIAQCEDNIDYLASFTIDAPEDDYGAIPLQVVRKNGKTLSGPVQVNDFTVTRGRGDRTVFMEVVLLGGHLNYLD